MKLKDLLKNVADFFTEKEIEITGIAVDSKKVKVGYLYIALAGRVYDGYDFIEEAISNGAVAVIAEKKYNNDTIIVKNTRKAYAQISANFYGNPEKQLKLVAVVGTNGKTTTTHILQHILNFSGIKCATIGTLGFRIGDTVKDCLLTTPDPNVLSACLAECKAQGIQVVIMEVSAHAIFFEKVSALKFDIGLFTNLSQDHLDFFEDLQNYINVKKSFFVSQNVSFSIINADDNLGQQILQATKVLKASYGISSPADVFAMDIEQDVAGSRFTLNAFDMVSDVYLPLPGIYNIYNTLASVAAAIALKVPMDLIKHALCSLTPPDGRFNVINTDKMVIIDYAHTPDGLENLLKAVVMLKKKNLITVFGCGGNRDRAKRPIMGAISQKYSDLVILTSDNPRLEEPADIIADIAVGMQEGYISEPDRAEAIKMALTLAKENDIVVIAGKGAECYLDIKGEKIPYSDMEEVKKHMGEYK